MTIDYAKAQLEADRLHANAKDGTLKIDGEKYVLTFNRLSGVYDVTLNGERVASFNTRKITQARKWLREYVEI